MHPIESAQIAELRREELQPGRHRQHRGRAGRTTTARAGRRSDGMARVDHVLAELHLRPARAH